MALFKILRGESTNLANTPVTDGFAYFTPEDGKFYIDYGTSGDEPIFGRSSTPNLGQPVPNRICINDHNGVYQPLDADLTAIAGLSGTSGFLKKTATDTWSLDTNSYSLASHNHNGTYAPTASPTFTGTVTAPTFVGSLGEAYLTWGGKNFSGSYGCIDAAMIGNLGANRFAFLQALGITIEYSRDSGASWSDYGATDAQKVALFSGLNSSFLIGKADAVNKATAAYQLRVTINTGAAQLYTVLNKFCIYCSTNGSTGTTCTIDAALEATPTTFVTMANAIPISGWSGYNIINIPGFATYGNTASSQYGRVRFTFKSTGGSGTYNGLTISSIYGFGGVGWTVPSNMAANGHLYTWDASQNAIFPANITGKQLISNIATGTSPLLITSTTTVTNLNADLLDGNHASAFSLASHNHNGAYQAADADLTAIAGLTGTTGLLRKTAANTWTLDTTALGDMTVATYGGSASGIVAKSDALKETRAGATEKVWVGTKAQYNAIATKDTQTCYITTDETYGSYISLDETGHILASYMPLSVSNHVASTSNPHGVTKNQVGLGNVNNTADIDKPISLYVQAALDLKAASNHTHSAYAPINNPTFTGTVSGITATMVGLGNVTNQSKSTMFTNPTFTGTVSGITAPMVGLGNVTNESKSTMFNAPTFTGIAKATGNTSYTTSQLRNISINTAAPTPGAGSNGDIWIVYT